MSRIEITPAQLTADRAKLAALIKSIDPATSRFSQNVLKYIAELANKQATSISFPAGGAEFKLEGMRFFVNKSAGTVLKKTPDDHMVEIQAIRQKNFAYANTNSK